jgi:hypothetical protein
VCPLSYLELDTDPLLRRRPYNNTVGVFYSDQRDSLHSQKLAHQESTDLVHWGPVIDDVSFLNYTDRPGMTVITYLPRTGQWMLVHEFPGGGTANSINWGVRPNPVYYRFAYSPFNFRYGYSYPIAVNRVQPNASPYVVWTPAGGVNGTIIVSDNHWNSVFTNQFNGEPDKWEEHSSGAPKCYSRPLHIVSVPVAWSLCAPGPLYLLHIAKPIRANIDCRVLTTRTTCSSSAPAVMARMARP